MRASSRLLLRAGTVAGVVGILSFFLMRNLPGDAAYRIAAARYGYDVTNSAAANAVRAELALDQPWWTQLGAWLGQLAQGDLGHSLVSGERVWDDLSHQLGQTLALSLTAWALALATGLMVGTALALWGKAWPRRVWTALAMTLRASPSFVVGLLLATWLAVHANWLPAAGHRVVPTGRGQRHAAPRAGRPRAHHGDARLLARPSTR